MKKNLPFLALMIVALLATACSPTQRYVYIEDVPHDTPMPITNNFETTIYPNDQLYIFVNSQSPESVRLFNEETNKTLTNTKTKTNVKREKHGYLVSQSGHIVFPVLGRIKVDGKTRKQLANDIEQMLIQGGYVLDPVVTVEIMNFHVTVIGEVAEPKVVLADGGRLTIFEALAQCGDVTIDGMRTNVVVVRSSFDSQTVDTVDLTRKEILNSPYYYLRQNDIIFVEPTEKKKRTAWRDSDWLQYTTIGAHALQVAYMTIYRIQYSAKK